MIFWTNIREVEKIGLTRQMHGIVYIDKEGKMRQSAVYLGGCERKSL